MRDVTYLYEGGSLNINIEAPVVLVKFPGSGCHPAVNVLEPSMLKTMWHMYSCLEGCLEHCLQRQCPCMSCALPSAVLAPSKSPAALPVLHAWSCTGNRLYCLLVLRATLCSIMRSWHQMH
jgi:hypothetical protein